MFTLQEFRKANPQYAETDSVQLAQQIYRANPELGDISFEQFAERVGVKSDQADRDPVRASDFPRSVAISLDRVGQLAGRGMQAIGLDETGQQVEQLYKDRETQSRAEQSAGYKQEMEKPFIEKDEQGRHFGPAWTSPTKIAGTVLESSGQTALGMGTGAAITASLIRFGMSGPLAGIVGGAIGEGGTAGAESAKDAYDVVMSAPIDQLSQSAEFQQAVASLQSQGLLSPDKLYMAARQAVAKDAAVKTGASVAAVTAAFGAPSGAAIGKAIKEGGKSFVGTAGRQAVHETLQEVPQSGFEQYAANKVQQKFVDPAIDPMQGVDEAMAEGGVAGFVSGGALGGALHRSKPAIDPTKPTDLLQDEKTDQAPAQPAPSPTPTPQQPVRGPGPSPLQVQNQQQIDNSMLGFGDSIEDVQSIVNRISDRNQAEREAQEAAQQAEIQGQQWEAEIRAQQEAEARRQAQMKANFPPRQAQAHAIEPLQMQREMMYHEGRTGVQRLANRVYGDQSKKPIIAGTPEGDMEAVGSWVDEKAHEAATSPENKRPDPTEPQIEAGNYKKGHVRIDGLDISIENPQGSTRSGTAEDGRKWSTTMNHHYGYIKGTLGGENEQIDTFVKPGAEASPKVFVVDQHNPNTGKFDEVKVMLGFDSKEEAAAAYQANYEEGWQGGQAITEATMEDFKKWAFDDDRGNKPFAGVPLGSPETPPVSGGSGDQVSMGDAGKTKLTFEEFEKAYREAFEQGDRYTPDQVGFRDWTERMAELADAYPEWAERVENMPEPITQPSQKKPETKQPVKKPTKKEQALKKYTDYVSSLTDEQREYASDLIEDAPKHPSGLVLKIRKKLKGMGKGTPLTRVDGPPPRVDNTKKAEPATRGRRDKVDKASPGGGSKKGNRGTAYLPDNTPVAFQYAIVDVDDLITSHNDDFSMNENFPQELQPRDRARDTMKLQISEISNKLNPERLGEDSSVSKGAPIIGPDMVVESGNGRTMAIRKDAARSEKYHQWVKNNASKFGINGKIAARRPVLVRVRADEKINREEFVKSANKDDVAKLSDTEQAIADTESLTQEDMQLFNPGEDGDIGSAGNRPFVNRFVGKMSASEQNAYLTEDGRANQALVKRIKAAVFYKAYGDESLLKMIAEETSPDIQRILTSLAASAPKFAKARAVDPEMGGIGIVGHIVGAINFIRDARREYPDIKASAGKPKILNQVLKHISPDQNALFGEEKVPEATIEAAKHLAENSNSGKRMAEFLKGVGNELISYLSEKPQQLLFGETLEKPSSSDIINKTAAKLEEKYEEKQKEIRFPGGVDAVNEQGERFGRTGKEAVVTAGTDQGPGERTGREDGGGIDDDTTLQEPPESFIKGIRFRQQDLFSSQNGKGYSVPDYIQNQRVRMATTGDISFSGGVVRDEADAAALLAHLRKRAQEELYTVATDADGNILEIHQYSKGSKNASEANPIEIVGHTLDIPDIKHLYVIHNHPSGSPYLSASDIAVYNRLKSITELKKIQPHMLVVAGTRWGSQFERGDIRPTIRSTKLPVKTRMLNRSSKIVDAEKLNSSHRAEVWLSKNYPDRDAIIFLNSELRPAGVMPFPAGVAVRDAAAAVVSFADSTNAVGMIIKTKKKMSPKRKRFLKDFGGAFSDTGMIQIFDVIEDSVSHADSNRLRTLISDNMDGAKNLQSDEQMPRYSTKDVRDTPEFRRRFNGSKVRTAALSDIQSLLSGAIKKNLVAVGQSENGDVWVRTKSGHALTVEFVDEVQNNERAFRLGYNKQKEDGEVIAGSYLADVIKISPAGDKWTVAHEMFGHWLEDAGLLNKLDLNVLDNAAKKAGITDRSPHEARAAYLEQYLERRAEYAGQPIGRVLQKIADFIDALVNIFKKTARGVARDIESGRIFERQVNGRTYQTMQPAYDKTASRWYSQMEKVIEQKMAASMSPKMLKGTLKSWANKGQFKMEELEWSGVLDWLDMQSGKVSKEDVVSYLFQNNVRVEEVVKRGSENTHNITRFVENWEDFLNKKEVYEYPGIYEDLKASWVDEETNRLMFFDGPEDFRKAFIESEVSDLFEQEFVVGLKNEIEQGYVDGDGYYREAETRYNRPDLVLPGGKNYKELLLTLPTPDWYYPGRQDAPSPEAAAKPYRSAHWPDDPNVLAHVRFSERETDGKRILHIEEIQSDWGQAKRKNEDVPEAPYVGSTTKWAMLAFRRMVRHAAEHGFDTIAWTPGDIQSARYDLSKKISRIDWQHDSIGKLYTVEAYGMNDDIVWGDTLTAEKLEDHIGKDPVKKIVESKDDEGTLSGLDLQVGGEGMRGFYDKILPASVNKMFNKKTWGNAKVGKIKIGPIYPISEYGGIRRLEESSYKAVHALPITPEMKRKALNEGMPLFSVKKPDVIDEKFGRSVKTWDQRIADVFSSLKNKDQRRAMIESKIITGGLDRLHPIKQLGDEAYKLHRLETGFQLPFAMFMENGKLEWDGSALIVREKGNGVMKFLDSLGKDWEKLFYWTAAKRAEKLEAEGRENWLDAAAREKIFEWAGAADDKDMLKASERLQEFNKNILDVAQEAGLIDPISRAQWMKDFYVPFYRIFEDEKAREEFLSSPKLSRKHISAQIKRLKGADQKLGDPVENILHNWMHLIHESMRNKARAAAFDSAMEKGLDAIEQVDEVFSNKKLREMARDMGVFQQGMKRKDLIAAVFGDPDYELPNPYATLKQREADNVLVFRRNGEPVYFKVHDPELFNALSNVNVNKMDNLLVRMMGETKRWLSYGATFGPAFRIRNMIRDTLHTAIVEKDFKVFADSAMGFIKSIRQDEDYIAFMASGAGFGSSYTKSDDPQAGAKYIRRILDKENNHILDTPKKLLDWWEAIGEASENAARMMLYKNARKRGESHLDAAFRGRDILDFTMRGGSGAVQFLIQTIPFLNARAQGLYKLGRAWKENPYSFTIKGGMLTAASLAIWAMFKDDERYKELEDWAKWSYYHVWMGDHHYWIPKPFEVGVIFSSMFETTANVISGNEQGKHLTDFVGHALRDTFALDMPQFVKPMVEQWANKDTFTGRPIVGMGLQGLPEGLQAEPWTSETMQVLGEALGVSPKRAEHLVRSYFSTLGMFVLGASDVLFHHMYDFPEDPSWVIDDYVGVGAFVRRGKAPQRNIKQITWFYETMGEIDELVRAVNYYKNNGQLPEARELVKANRLKVKYRKPFNRLRRDLSEINKEIKRVRKSALKPELKRLRTDELTALRNRLVKQAYDITGGKL